MITWIKAHKVLTSVSCLLLAAALVGTTLLVSGRVNTVSGSDPVYGVYSGISESETVSVTLANGTTAQQYAGTRDPYYWPFASDSIWNMPIGSGAVLTTVPVFQGTRAATGASSSGTGNAYAADKERIYSTNKTDKEYMVIRSRSPLTSRGLIKSILSAGGTFTYKGTEYNLFDSTGTNYQYNKGKAYWPTDLVVNDAGNEIAAVVQPDRRTVAQFQINRGYTDDTYSADKGLALFPYDGSYDSGVENSQKFLISNLALVDLYGDGIYGSHWGSALSAMGGSIREGELTTKGVDIHHALKLNVNDSLLFYGIVTEAALNKYNAGNTNKDNPNGHYAAGDVVPGYTWPATKHDSQTENTATDSYGNYKDQVYRGSNPFVTMGSLLTVSQSDYDKLAKKMKTDIGKKILNALRYYGCYIVDNTNYNPYGGDDFEGFAWSVSDKEIAAVEKTYGITLSGYHRRSNSSDKTKAYCEDMDAIILCLRAAINNAPGSVGGGGTPSKPLAPEIGPLEGITVEAQTIPMESETTLDVLCTPSNASVQAVTYQSSNPSVIEVTENGKLKGLSAGTATVTVTSAESGFTTTCTVTVGGGDVNGDGKVDAKDYATLSDALSKGDLPTAAEEKKRYDINGDGIIYNDDLDALKKLLLKGGSAQ